jgi:hypothetical protein
MTDTTAQEDTAGPLTAGELREILAEVPADRLVVLSRDAEGNGYSPAYGFSHGMYVDQTGTVGEVHPTPEELAKDAELRDLFGATPESAVLSLVLYPLG